MTHSFTPERGTFFDLSPRVKLRITGGDALRFLNGQISNDLRKATPDQAIQAAVLNAKGKLNANIFVASESDSFVLDADPEVREELPARIERYIIADDVQIEDISDAFAMLHVTGGEAPLSSFEVARRVHSNRFDCPGVDLWLNPAAIEAARRELAVTLVFCDETCAEILRIERGIPRWGRELSDQIIPNEANLEARTIDYSKGCYIGQEVISRIKMSGQTNKRLCGLASISGTPLYPGMRLSAGGENERDAGWITSATHSERFSRQIALGYVKRGFDSVGTHLVAISNEESPTHVVTPVEVVGLPFT